MLEKLKSKLSPDKTVQEPGAVKKKQTVILAAVLLAFFAIAFVGVLFSEKKPKEVNTDIKRKTVGSKLDAPGGLVTGKDAWVNATGQQITDLQREKEELTERLKKLEESVTTIQEKADALAKMPPAPGLPSQFPVPPGLPGQVSGAGMQNFPLPGGIDKSKKKGITTTEIGAGDTQTQSGGAQGSFNTAGLGASKGNQTVQIASSTPATTANSASNAGKPNAAGANAKAANESMVDNIVGKVNQASDLKKKVAEKRNYLPPGTFFKTVMLASLDAPTSGQTQANPHPVLLRIVDNAVLPNQFAGQVRECFIVGAGYGDLSSERAYIRTETLSCISKKGLVIDVPISGWIIGEDGKAGMRGKLVSKQGQALASAMSSAVLAGISNMIGASAVTTTQTSLGTTQTVPNSGAAFRAGFGDGVSKGVERLTQFYISLAEKLFPVIEIDSGRTVDIALNKGLDLSGMFEGAYQASLLETPEDLEMLGQKNVANVARKSIIK